jgi:hypothetical protein
LTKPNKLKKQVEEVELVFFPLALAKGPQHRGLQLFKRVLIAQSQASKSANTPVALPFSVFADRVNELKSVPGPEMMALDKPSRAIEALRKTYGDPQAAVARVTLSQLRELYYEVSQAAAFDPEQRAFLPMVQLMHRLGIVTYFETGSEASLWCYSLSGC